MNFADQATGQVYLRIERGKPILKYAAAFAAAMQNADSRAAIGAVAPEALRGNVGEAPDAETLYAKDGATPTLGQWGPLA